MEIILTPLSDFLPASPPHPTSSPRPLHPPHLPHTAANSAATTPEPTKTLLMRVCARASIEVESCCSHYVNMEPLAIVNANHVRIF